MLIDALTLNNFSNLFIDESAFRLFCDRLTAVHNSRMPRLIILDKTVIGGIVSESFIKQLLEDRLLKSVMQKPQVLQELLSRIEEDDIVDEDGQPDNKK